MENNLVNDVSVESTINAEHMEQIPLNSQTNNYDIRIIVLAYLFLGVAGIGTGYLLSRNPGVNASINNNAVQNVKMIKEAKVAGVTDTRTFSDSAEGVLEKGGLNGEGTHKLVRDGGPSQTAYLISSVIDLDEYAGKKVKVWGQTMAAKKAAWLMDVGKIEIE